MSTDRAGPMETVAAPTPERRLRVLVVNLGRRGGVTEYGWLMAQALSRQAAVAAVYSEHAENRGKYARLTGRKLAVKTFSGPVGLVLSMLALDRLARIARFARRFRPDVIYYPGGHAWKPLLDVLLPRSAITVHTVHDPELHPGEDSIASRLLTWANRRRADGYVLLSHARYREFAARRGLAPEQVAVIPHGVFDDYRPVEGGPRDMAARLGNGSPDAGSFVLFVGRFRWYKGIETLLEAYGLLAPEAAGPLVIAGSGELSDEEARRLKELDGRPVTLLNRWLSDGEMAGLVAAARFVVLPYRSSTQSGVIPLASAFGVPAIASATGGLVEQVVDQETGWLFPPGDPEALRDLLARAYAMDDASYELMSRRCRAHAQAEWSWDVLARRLLEFCVGLRRRAA